MTDRAYDVSLSGHVDVGAYIANAHRVRAQYTAELLRKGFAAIGKFFAKWQANRQAFAELNDVDPRLLADMGVDSHALARGVIRRVEDSILPGMSSAFAVGKVATPNAAEKVLKTPAQLAAANSDYHKAA
jgi:uncharacterized protein YjiS (DUF1127 family)